MHCDEVIIHRLHIGHTFLTHGHLLKRDSQPQCSVCQTQLTVEHVLLHCPMWNAIRVNHFAVTSLLDLFSEVAPRCIISPIMIIRLYILSFKCLYHFYIPCLQFLRLSFLHLYHFWIPRLLSFQAVGFYLQLDQFWSILDAISLSVLMCR